MVVPSCLEAPKLEPVLEHQSTLQNPPEPSILWTLYMCAQTLVYKHHRRAEACFPSRGFLTMNFTYVPKRLYTSTRALLYATKLCPYCQT